MGIILFIGEGDKLSNHKNNLASMMRVLNQTGIPARIFGMYTKQLKTHAIIIVDGITYTGQKDGNADYGQGYDMNQLGTLISEATTAYKEAFPQGIPLPVPQK